jgi:hypothetical protein
MQRREMFRIEAQRPGQTGRIEAQILQRGVVTRNRRDKLLDPTHFRSSSRLSAPMPFMLAQRSSITTP